MFTVLFPSGRTLTFGTLVLAETYAVAYKGVILSNPVEDMVIA